jgi:hypothetical protein
MSIKVWRLHWVKLNVTGCTAFQLNVTDCKAFKLDNTDS